jgi:tetratricopeptide (TPR) repeat protein
MKTQKWIPALLILLDTFSSASAQNQLRIDSLNRRLAATGDTNRVVTLLALSREYVTADSAKAIRYAREANALATSLDFPKGQVLASLRTGDAHYANHNNSNALQSFTQGLALAQSTRQRRYVAVFLQRLGDVWQELGGYERSVDYYIQSLQLFERLNQPRDVAISCNNLGITFAKLEDNTKALAYFNRALPIYEKLNNKLSLVNTYNNIGNLHQDDKQYATAEQLFRRCIHLAEDPALSLYHTDLLSGFYQNLGNNYYKQRKYRTALVYYDSALRLEYKLNDKPNIAGTLINKAYCYKDLNEAAKAIPVLSEAASLIQVLKNQPLKAEWLGIYADVYEKQGDYKKALEYTKQHVSLRDSLFDQTKNQQIQELQIRYETEKKEEQIKLLTEQGDLKTRLNYASLGIIAAIVLLLGLLHNRYQLRGRLFTQREKLLTEKTQRSIAETKLAAEESRRMQAELDYKQRELTSATVYLCEKNEWLTAVKSQLRQSNGQLTDEKLRQLTKSIDQNIELDTNWNRFKLHFDRVHPNFFATLQTQFSQLSPNELKHCAYVRINLSIKEVATLMNITPKGVKMARYRIKKRLHLLPDDDLYVYLNNL